MKRLTPFGWSELRRFVRARGELPDRVPHSSWVEPHPCGLRLEVMQELVSSWSRVEPGEDAGHAIALHEAMPLPRRRAADRLFWAWLAAFGLREYTLRRWAEPGRPFNLHRVGRDIPRNTWGRLWWGSELTKVSNIREVSRTLELLKTGDVYFFTRYLFSSHQIHLALLSRDLSRVRTVCVGFLAAMSSLGVRPSEVEQLIKPFNLVLSTVLADGFGVGEDGYAVDPERCAAVVQLAKDVTRSYLDQQASLSARQAAAVQGAALSAPSGDDQPVQKSHGGRSSRIQRVLDRLGRLMGGPD